MKVVEIDVVDSEPRARFLKGLVDVFGVSTDRSSWDTMGDPEFGSEEDLVALAGPFEPAAVSLEAGENIGEYIH